MVLEKAQLERLRQWLGQAPARDKLLSPQPWPLALPVTFNQVLVMPGPAVRAGPLNLPTTNGSRLKGRL